MSSRSKLNDLKHSTAYIQATKKAKLRALFPESIAEDGAVDFEKIALAIGQKSPIVNAANYKFGLNWPGKTEAFKNAFSQLSGADKASIAHALPIKHESLDFDERGRMILDGDSLDSIKLLNGRYSGKIKMIYVDPPYNSKSFNHFDEESAFLPRTEISFDGQEKAEEVRLCNNLARASELHTKWLSMIYPRLILARALLREDGVIFLSINDLEADNLKRLCTEIFGEDNFLAQIVLQKPGAIGIGEFRLSHEYILAFGNRTRPIQDEPRGRLLAFDEPTADMLAAYSNPDNDIRGPWRAEVYSRSRGECDCLGYVYPIMKPETSDFILPDNNQAWKFSKEAHELNVKNNRVFWHAHGEGVKPVYKRFLSELGALVPQTVWPWHEVNDAEENHPEIRFESKQEKQSARVFLTDPAIGEGSDSVRLSRGIKLMKRLLGLARTGERDLVLGVFDGAQAMAAAVESLNSKDGAGRRFILVRS